VSAISEGNVHRRKGSIENVEPSRGGKEFLGKKELLQHSRGACIVQEKHSSREPKKTNATQDAEGKKTH